MKQKSESDNIDDILNSISDGDEDKPLSLNEMFYEEETSIVVSNKDTEIDLEEKHSLANRIVENTLKVLQNAELVFKQFSDDVFHGKDSSTSSKEALIKSLEVQNNANKNLIDLAKVLNGNDKGNTNILIGASISPKQSGINLDNIRKHSF